jgi:hypothetical protein
VIVYHRGTDSRSIPRIRIPGEHPRDRSVLVGKLAEILKDERPTRKVAAMFIDMAFGSPIYERLRALGFNNVFETNFGLVQTPDRTKANMRADMWDKMKDWLLHGAIETDELKPQAATLRGSSRTLRPATAYSTTSSPRVLDQQTSKLRRRSSLNSSKECLKVVETRRVGDIIPGSFERAVRFTSD